MKTKRIISLILALTLLTGVFSVLPVYAEEASSQAVEIFKHNVVYKETIQIAYAVKCDIGTDVTVKYTVDGKTYDAMLYSETYVENGKEYPVYVTHGFYATQYTDVVSTTAYIGDAAPASAAYDTYSVAEYFYSMLYKNGYINCEIDENNIEATKTKADKKNLYLSVIDYGKYAQEVLINNKGGESTLITDYAYFYAAKNSGVTINGEESALVLPGSEVTFGGSATGYMITLDGETVDAAGTYTAVAGQVIAVSAKSEDVITVMDYENGASNEFVKSYDGDGNLITGNFASNTSILDMGLETKSENTYLHVRNPKNSEKIGKTEVQISNTIPTGNCYTFETKINMVGLTNNYNFAQVKFVNNNDGAAVNLFLIGITNGTKANLGVTVTGGNSNLADKTVLFDYNEKSIGTGSWFTLRIEFYFEGAGNATAENTYMKLYVDDVLAFDGLAHWALGANISHVEISHVFNANNQNACYDDIYFTRTDKAYVEGNN